eukprot:TRINITY_DN26346_c1_g1_i2.p1 TRINITY_DN26346_c1_g1~~TRINITY_DN26346_c1_g1_i2.p1  ORF type:complete len:427 (+),score=110.16 TRINITY_DN26346_c1_g1_i2:167-1447(+)
MFPCCIVLEERAVEHDAKGWGSYGQAMGGDSWGWDNDDSWWQGSWNSGRGKGQAPKAQRPPPPPAAPRPVRPPQGGSLALGQVIGGAGLHQQQNAHLAGALAGHSQLGVASSGGVPAMNVVMQLQQQQQLQMQQLLQQQLQQQQLAQQQLQHGQAQQNTSVDAWQNGQGGQATQQQQMLLQQQQQQQLAQQQQQQSAVPQEHDKGIQRQSVHGQAEQAAPSRASSAPRVSGLMGGYGGVHGHMAKGASHAAPAVGSTLRTPSQPMSQSMQTSPPHYSARQMVEKQRHTIGPEQRHTLGPGSPSQNSLTGIPPTSPQPMRGASPAPGQGMGMVTGSMNAARTHQPMSMSPGQFPFGGYRPEMPSGARGRSPPPAAGLQGGPGQARQPRAVTPGALVKGISQSIHGPPMQRQSLGGGGYSGMVHRGFG